MKILAVHDIVVPIASAIRNAYIDFSQMTASVVAVVTDVKRDGKTVVGFGFNSNGRYAPSGLLRERFIPRLKAAPAGEHRRRQGPHRPVQGLGRHDEERKAGRAWRALGRGRRARHGAVGRCRQGRGRAALAPPRRPLSRRAGRRARLGLCRRRLLLPGQGSREAARRDALLPRARLSLRQDEDRRHLARR